MKAKVINKIERQRTIRELENGTIIQWVSSDTEYVIVRDKSTSPTEVKVLNKECNIYMCSLDALEEVAFKVIGKLELS